MERRQLIILVLCFVFSTAIFYYNLLGKQHLENVVRTVKIREDEDKSFDAEQDSSEVLVMPTDDRRGTLQRRHRDTVRTVELPRVHLPDALPFDHSPARPHRPNLTHLADLPLADAFTRLVREYLSPWLHPLDPLQPFAPVTQRALSAMEYSYKGGAFRVRISNSRLYYRKLVYWKQTYRSQRMLWYLRLLHEVLIKDGMGTTLRADFVVYVGDGPKVAADTFTTDAGFPLFSLRTSLAHVDIPVPDPVSFGSNGQYQWSEAGKSVPWGERADKVVFRGRGSCLKMQADNWHVCNRVRAQRLSAQHPELFDMGVIEWNQLYQSRLCEPLNEAEVETSTGLRKVDPLDFDAQSRFKYILDLDGGLGSSRKPGILSSGSALFAQDSPWYTWYEPLLSAYRHYIPVDKWLRGLDATVKWAIRHDDTMREIQRSGAAFERKFLSISASKQYMEILLREYQKLLAGLPDEGNAPVEIDYCEKMRGSQGAAEIAAGPMGCSREWFEYTGEASVPDYVINDRAAFKNTKETNYY